MSPFALPGTGAVRRSTWGAILRPSLKLPASEHKYLEMHELEHWTHFYTNYGYGLGLFGQLGVTSALGIGMAVYAAQVLFSAWWLRRYRYGPVEWLWRTLMYGAAQPMRQTV